MAHGTPTALDGGRFRRMTRGPPSSSWSPRPWPSPPPGPGPAPRPPRRRSRAGVVGQEGLELDHRPGGVVAVLVEDHAPEEVGVGEGGVGGHRPVEGLQRLVGQTRPLEEPAPVGEGFDVVGLVDQDLVVELEGLDRLAVGLQGQGLGHPIVAGGRVARDGAGDRLARAASAGEEHHRHPGQGGDDERHPQADGQRPLATGDGHVGRTPPGARTGRAGTVGRGAACARAAARRVGAVGRGTACGGSAAGGRVARARRPGGRRGVRPALRLAPARQGHPGRLDRSQDGRRPGGVVVLQHRVVVVGHLACGPLLLQVTERLEQDVTLLLQGGQVVVAHGDRRACSTRRRSSSEGPARAACRRRRTRTTASPPTTTTAATTGRAQTTSPSPLVSGRRLMFG